MPSSSLLVSLSAEFALGESSGWFWLSGEMVSFLSFFFMSCGCLVALVLSIFSCCLFYMFVCTYFYVRARVVFVSVDLFLCPLSLVFIPFIVCCYGVYF